MNPHPRIRKTAKWTALVLGVLLVAAGAVSIRWRCECIRWTPTNTRSAGMHAARIYVTTDSAGGFSHWGWYSQRSPRPWVHWWPQRVSVTASAYEAFYLPLWIPALTAFGAWGALWRWDIIATRRARAGVCPTCSYDRAGLALSAPCPECGKAVA